MKQVTGLLMRSGYVYNGDVNVIILNSKREELNFSLIKNTSKDILSLVLGMKKRRREPKLLLCEERK